MSAAIAPHMADPAIAQITPDDTLGTESTTTVPNVTINDEPAVLIQGGAARENSLFHSFEQFNIGENQRVYFANPTDISAIFSRVTGTDTSNILGTLGVNGPADLFFINPNGILFGPNATLDINGSLFVSTAESLRFQDGTTFSAASRQSPPLLTISTPVGLQYGEAPAAIALQGSGHNLSTESRNPGLRIVQDGRHPGLQVPSGETLALIGGDVTLAGANITTEGGRLEVGSVGAGSLVNIASAGDRLSTNYEGVSHFGNIVLTDAAAAVANGDSGVFIRGGHITLAQDAVVLATNGASVGVTAAEELQLKGAIADPSEPASFSTGLMLQTDPNSIINGGSLTVDTPRFSIGNGAGILNQNFGAGAGSPLNIQAQQLQMQDGSFILAGTYSEGAGGSTNIQSQRLNIDGSIIAADTFAAGAGGNVTIQANRLNAQNQATIATDSFATGHAGNVNIQTQQAQLQNGAFVSALGRSTGAGGSVALQAQERLQIEASGLFTETLSADGGGTIDLSAPQIEITDGSVVSSSTGGTGQGGNIDIRADRLQITDAAVSADTLDQGAGGNVNVTSNNIEITRGQISALTALATGDGGNIVLDATEAITLSDRAQVNTESGITSSGDSGNINIQTGTLRLQQGSQLVSRSIGAGNAGNVMIQATDEVVLEKSFLSPDGTIEIASAILALLEFQSVGEGGNIDITTGSLSVLDGAELLANTFGKGDAGDVTITASEEVTLDGVRRLGAIPGGIFSNVGPGGEGTAGRINIQAANLSVLNGARIASSIEGTVAIPGRPAGKGQGGEINIDAGEVLLAGTDATGDRISGLFTDTQAGAVGQGGRITVRANTLRVAEGAQINSQTENASDSGNVDIDTRSQLAVDSNGEITVNSRDAGSAGSLRIASPAVVLDSGGITAQTSSGNGGNINLQVDDVLLLRNGSELSSTAGSAGAGGNGGDIAIEAGFIAAIAQENSDITANSFNGQGGNISVNTQGVLGIQTRDQPTFRSDITASSALGQNGVVVINTPEISPDSEEPTLPSDVLDTFNPINQSLCSGDGSQFTFSRTGGVPASPYDTLNGAITWEDWYISKERESSREISEREISERETLEREMASKVPSQPQLEGSPLKEAQRWDVDANGNIVFLLSSTLSSSIESDPTRRVSCQKLSDILSHSKRSVEARPDVEILP